MSSGYLDGSQFFLHHGAFMLGFFLELVGWLLLHLHLLGKLILVANFAIFAHVKIAFSAV